MEQEQQQNIKLGAVEKILFCVDVSGEMGDTNILSKTRTKPSARWVVVEHMIKMFVQLKYFMNKSHMFGLVHLRNSAELSFNFTKDVSKFQGNLGLEPKSEYKSFDMSSVFDEFFKLVDKEVTVEEEKIKNNQKPSYVYRIITIYGRSNVVPEMKDRRSYERFLNSPICFIDNLYLHKKPGKELFPQEVYDFLNEFANGSPREFYNYETHSQLKVVYNAFNNFLGNPLQRLPQEQADSIAKKSPK